MAETDQSAQKRRNWDVIVIGAGGAGCSAAIEAARMTDRVCILAKSTPFDSKTANAQGGLQASFADDDTPDLHFDDTIRAGKGKSKPELVRILADNARETVFWLEDHGVQFDRTGDRFALKTGAGISRPRVLSCGDSTGNRVMKPILEAVQKANIRIFWHSAVYRAKKTEDGFDLEVRIDGAESRFSCRSLVLATGGLIPREKRAGMKSNNASLAPDGVELAEQLGAEVVNADLMQYHPTGVILPAVLRRERLPETLRGAGARLLDRNLEEFTDALATRGELTDAIVKACEEGRGVQTEDGRVGVWLTTPDVDRKNGTGYLAANYPKFDRLFKEHDHDLSHNNVLVYPIVHYSLGGVDIRENAETSVAGLFAAGESTWGVHGDERLMGNSLLDIFVFGRIAGRNAAMRATGVHQ